MNLADSVLSLDPFLIQFTESLGIRWYSLAYLAGFVLGYLSLRHMSRKGTIHLSEIEIGDFVVYVALGTLIGGRVGYALFYSQDLLWAFDSSFPFWGVFKVYQGGMASHGGILGIVVGCLLYARKYKKPFLHLVDLTVFGGALGIFFGRIANFINGELFGRAAPEGYSWAVRFPTEMHLWGSAQIEKLQSLAPAAEALGELSTRAGEKIKLTADLWMGWVANFGKDLGSTRAVEQTISELILKTQSGHEGVLQALAPALTPRYPSQLYQALAEGLLVFILLSFLWLKPQKPGVISGYFGVFYSIARIWGEQFRMPDAHIGFQLFGLTRGQWLSIGFLVFALSWLVYSLRRDEQKLGGWGIVPVELPSTKGSQATKKKNRKK